MKTTIVRLLFVLLVLSGCNPLSSAPVIAAEDWQPASLRALLPDGETSPEWDLVAASIKVDQGQVVVRLDVLDMQPETRLQAYLTIDDRAGGSRELPFAAQSDLEWDMLVRSTPVDGIATVLYPDGRETTARRPWMEVDPQQDVLIFHLAGLQLDVQNARFQAFILQPGSDELADSSSVFAFRDAAPKRAPLLLAFWNSLPAGSPAQAMRRWNGAHTGPEGHRHGLYQLLKASKASSVPIVLLDLKNPESLAGLDLVGDLDLVKELQREGLLLLPDVVDGDPLADATSLEIGRIAASRFGLASSTFLYGPVRAEITGQFAGVFTAHKTRGLSHSHGIRLIPLPGETGGAPPATAQGPSVEIRRLLLAAARGNGYLTVLGGSVPDTVWADAVYAGPTFAYFAQHPWIEPLNEAGLQALPVQATASIIPPSCTDVLCSTPLPASAEAQRAHLRAEIGALTDITARELAWEMYLQLTRPAADANRARLQANYLSQMEPMLAAAKWAQSPTARSECLEETASGQICYLASEQLFAALDSQGGRLMFLASKQKLHGYQQWLGPSTQFSVGLGDSTEWQLDSGAWSDPRAIPGAFLDEPGARTAYTPSAAAGEIGFRGADGSSKTYQMRGSGLTVTYENFPQANTRVLLTALPQMRLQTDWAERYRLERSTGENSLTWGIPDQGSVRISSSGPALTSTCFLDAGVWLSESEDPDRDYPPGHFLPIPARVIHFSSQGSFSIQLDVLDQ